MDTDLKDVDYYIFAYTCIFSLLKNLRDNASRNCKLFSMFTDLYCLNVEWFTDVNAIIFLLSKRGEGGGGDSWFYPTQPSHPNPKGGGKNCV